MSITTDIDIIRRLEGWEQREGKLPDFLQWYRRLLLIQIEAAKEYAKSNRDLSEKVISSGMIVERLTSGLPLLSSEELEVNQERMRAFFRKVVVLISVSLSEHGGETNALSRIADEDSVWKQAASSWYEGASLNPVADVCGVNSDLLGFVFQITFRPFLAFYAESLLPKIDQESWRRRYCPICGGKPDFAFLQRESGARWLVCSRCDAEWLFQRLECPYCGNHDQNTLSYFAVDEEPYRLYVCEVCQKYIKAIDLRVAREDVLIPLEKVLTLDLDRQAQEKGYMPG